MIKRFILSIVLCLPFFVEGQQLFSEAYSSPYRDGQQLIKPYRETVTLRSQDTSRTYVYRKLYQENFLQLYQDELFLNVNPLFNFSGGQASENDNMIYQNTRGIELKGSVGDHVVFNTSFYETQLNAPHWYQQYVSTYRVVPGSTNPKGYGEDGYDIGSVYGSFGVWQKLGEWDFLFRMGYDHTTIGAGYNSLFLSDFGLPYYFGSLKVEHKNLQYLHLTGSMQNPNFKNALGITTSSRPNTAAYQKKTYSAHYLNWKISEAFSVGFFESTVFQVADSADRTFSAAYINPLPLVNTLAYGLNHTDNVLVGLDLLVNISPSLSGYFQLVIDKNGSEGRGYLGSVKYRGKHWFLMLEATQIGDEVMANQDGRQSFSHYNQSLMHPAGAGVEEVMLQTGYRLKRWEAETNIVLRKKTEDLLFYTSSTEAEQLSHNFYDFTLRYVFNPHTRMQLFGQVIQYNGDAGDETFIRFGFRTQLRRENMFVHP